MEAPDDLILLREYARTGSEQPFATLVSRHVHLVYSAALRQTGNATLAQDITQIVFIILFQKAAKLRPGTILAGWLFQTTRYVAIDVVRREARRTHRELETVNMEGATEDDSAAWREISGFLDEAVGKLSATDRDAVLLRFFENKSLAAIAIHFGVSEEAAKKRVTRAVERMRVFFQRRGIVFSATMLGTVIASNAVQAAPPSVISTVSGLSAGTTVGASKIAAAKSAAKLMFWAKMKTAVAITAVTLMTGGSAIVYQATRPQAMYQGKSIDYWRAQLYSGNFQAHTALIAIGEPAVPALIEDFKIHDSTAKQWYRRLYAKLPASLANHIAKPVNIQAVRLAACGVLRELGPAAAKVMPEFAKALRESDTEVQDSVAFALEFMPDDRETLLALVDLLKKRTAKHRQLDNGDMLLYGLNGVLFHRDKYVEVAVPFLVSMLQQQIQDGLPNRFQVMRFCYCLERMGPKASGSIDVLRQLADNPERGIHLMALKTLWRIDHSLAPEIVRRVAAELRDPDVNTIHGGLNAATWARDEFPHDAEVLKPALLALAQGTNVSVSSAAVLVLDGFESPPEETLPLLHKLLSADNQGTRINAALQLAKRHHETNEAGVRALSDVIRSATNTYTKVLAAMNIWRINHDPANALGIITNAIVDGEKPIRYVLFQSLADLGADAGPAIPLMVDYLGRADHVDRMLAAQVLWAARRDVSNTIPVVVEALADRGVWSQTAALTLLSRMGDDAKPAVPAVVKLIQDKRTIPPMSAQATALLQNLDPAALAKSSREQKPR